jgi:hypothetical protein
VVDELLGDPSFVVPQKETRFLFATGIDDSDEVVAELEPISAAGVASAVCENVAECVERLDEHRCFKFMLSIRSDLGATAEVAKDTST